MNNGDDTAFYLACGFRVLAIEADPDLVAAACKRFKIEIESKRLTILNIGVAEYETTSEFWVNEVVSEWNSFDRDFTGRRGHPLHSIIIQCRRLDSILSEYGIPFYLKIDIEGNDIICCDQLSIGTRPEYISVEMSKMELLFRLRDLGYDRFKLITQFDLQPVRSREPKVHERVFHLAYWAANHLAKDRRLFMRALHTSGAKVLELANSLKLLEVPLPFKSSMLPKWSFAQGCSGTFGEDLPGEWHTSEEIAYIWLRETRKKKRIGKEFWCDLHARVSTSKHSNNQ
jgi:FkbM family methyltransferase